MSSDGTVAAQYRHASVTTHANASQQPVTITYHAWTEQLTFRGQYVIAKVLMLMQGLIEGTNKEVTPWVCDVRDIARAHVLAAEVPNAKGRYAYIRWLGF